MRSGNRVNGGPTTRALSFLLVLAGVFIVLLPFFWMLSSAFKPESEIFRSPPQWIPRPVQWANLLKSLTILPFSIYYRNTAIITAATMIGDVLTAAVVAYGFARFRFPGRGMPFHWLDTFAPIIVPAYFGGSAFYIFLLRQFFLTIPRELDDAAKMDGLGPFAIFSRIIFPLAKPALAIIAIFSFLYNWNDFFVPLIFLNSEAHYTVALGLTSLKGHFFSTINLLMAASLIAMLPCLVLFFLAQKYFMGGVVVTGVKG